MTGDEFDAGIARFDTRAEAQSSADAAMPRRKHNRPYAQFVGAYDAWTVAAPANKVLMKDGTFFDYGRNPVTRSNR